MIQIYLLLIVLCAICVDSLILSRQHPQQPFRGPKSCLLVSQRTNDRTTTSTIAPTSDDPNTPYSQINHNNTHTKAVAVNDIIWKIRPCENPTRWQMFHWYMCGIIDTATTTTVGGRLFQRPTTTKTLFPSMATRRRLSFLFSLRGRRRHHDVDPVVVVTATMHGVRLGRFGIVTEPGPVVPPPLSAAIQRIYGGHREDDDDIRAGAIVYMYVEPEYRGQDIGSVALAQVLPAIQRSCSGTHTLLVANDKTPARRRETRTTDEEDGYNHDDDDDSGDRKLVQWYQRHGYHVADELQDMLGSPNGIYGIAMISSLQEEEEEDPSPQIHPYRPPNIQWW